MTYIIFGAVTGLAYGFLIGFIKFIALWKKMIKSQDDIGKGALYLRLGIGYAINVVTLLFIYLTRNIMPFDFMATIIAAAVGLSLSGKLAPVSQLVNRVKEI